LKLQTYLNEEGLPLSLLGHEEVTAVNSGIKNIEQYVSSPQWNSTQKLVLTTN
jgi:hypothetical protein